MRLIVLWLLLTLAALAEPVQLLEGRLRLNLPDGFNQLSPEDIARKFPPVRPPKIAYANNVENMTVSIAIKVSDSEIKEGQLAAFGEAMSKILGSQGKIDSRGVVKIGERDWYSLVMVTQAVDQPIRNEMLFTPLGRQILMINLNSTVSDYPKYQKALEKTRQSLRL